MCEPDEEVATIRYTVYVEKRVYIRQGKTNNEETERIHDEMFTNKDEYMDAEPLDFYEPKIISRGH